MSEEVKQGSVAPVSPNNTRRRSRLPSGQALVEATSKLPRHRMAVTDGAPPAEDVEAAAAKKRATDEALYNQLLAAAVENPAPEAVAKAMGWPKAALEAFLIEHRQFASDRYDKVVRLHATAKAAFTAEPTPGADFIWTDDKRRRLVEKYVDTGDLLEAQQSIGCTPSQFNRERDSNADFARLVKSALKEARETLKMRAMRDGLAGNDKLLGVFLKQLESEGDADNPSKLGDAQLDERLKHFIRLVQDRLVETHQLTQLDITAQDFLKGSDLSLVLRTAISNLRGTGTHAGAATSVNRTAAELDVFLIGCADAGLTAEVEEYRAALKQLISPQPWPTRDYA